MFFNFSVLTDTFIYFTLIIYYSDSTNAISKVMFLML